MHTIKNNKWNQTNCTEDFREKCMKFHKCLIPEAVWSSITLVQESDYACQFVTVFELTQVF